MQPAGSDLLQRGLTVMRVDEHTVRQCLQPLTNALKLDADGRVPLGPEPELQYFAR